MERIAVLVASSPTQPGAQRAFGLVRSLASQGNRVTLALLEDGVLAATGRLADVPLADCASVLVLADDLALRGLTPDTLHPHCRTGSYGELVDLMMAETDRTLGTF